VRPEFYRAIAERMSRHDALSIRRRTVRATAAQARDLDWLAQQDGEPHAGHDCFVFGRKLLEGVDFGRVCIGFPPVGQVLLAALSTLAASFAELTEERLTFHANDDRQWRDPRFEDYWQFNQNEARLVLERLIRTRPLSPLAVRVWENLQTAPAFAPE